MARPVVGEVTTKLYDGLPEFYRHADEGLGYPLLLWLAGLFDQLTQVEDLITRLTYTPADEETP